MATQKSTVKNPKSPKPLAPAKAKLQTPTASKKKGGKGTKGC